MRHIGVVYPKGTLLEAKSITKSSSTPIRSLSVPGLTHGLGSIFALGKIIQQTVAFALI
jgi:hypothetical protein